MTTGLLLLAAHLIGDFPLQPKWMATEKVNDHGVRFVHVVIHTILVFVLLTLGGVAPDMPSTFYGVYAAAHFVIDSRRWVDERDDFPKWHYLIDQVMHITAIALLGAWFL